MSHLLWDLLRCTSIRLYIVYRPYEVVVTHPRSRGGLGSDEVRSKPPGYTTMYLDDDATIVSEAQAHSPSRAPTRCELR